MKIRDMTPDDIRVGDIMMRDVKVIDASETVRDAAKAMSTYDLRTLVVVDGHSVVGIICDEDIVRKLVAKNRQANTPVGELMTVELITTTRDTTLLAITQIMNEHGIGTIPIIDSDALVGIVTKTDIVRLYPTMMEHFKSNIAGSLSSKTAPTSSQGTCEICGNQANDLKQDDNGDWVCESCRE